ncbi:MAG: hypothetical protein ACUVWN_13445 [bacterium]
MKLNKKEKSNILGIIVALILITFVGFVLKSERYNHLIGKQRQTIDESQTDKKSSKNKTTSPFSKYKQIRQLSDCQVIIQRSLFEQLGGRKIERQVVELPKKIEVKTELSQKPIAQPNYLVLTGIAYLNGEPLALIEDNSKGKSYFLKKGDKIRDYTVDEIIGERVILVNGDSRVVQSLGSRIYYNVDGELLASNSIVSDSSNNAQVKSVSESVVSDKKDNNLSLIEQMRIRRKKELGQE